MVIFLHGPEGKMDLHSPRVQYTPVKLFPEPFAHERAAPLKIPKLSAKRFGVRKRVCELPLLIGETISDPNPKRKLCLRTPERFALHLRDLQ